MSDSDGRESMLHPLEFSILLVLMDGISHGYHIVRQIEARGMAGRTIYPANLYRRIRRLLDAGLIEEVDPPGSEPEGYPRRRYLAVTDHGRAAARAAAEEFRALADAAAAAGLLRPA